MKYRLDKDDLLDVMRAWDGFLKRKVHLIACGGTALTLLGIKESTKDVDLIMPEIEEYDYLITILKQLGYESASGWGWRREGGFIFDIFRGKRVHTTELLESPLTEGNNQLIKEFSFIYLGALNYYDLIITKIFRSDAIDIEDCIALVKSRAKEVNLKHLEERFRETASFDVTEEKMNKNLVHFLNILKKAKK